MEWVENALSTRRGTLVIGGGAALLAAIVLIVYLKSYRSNVNASNAPVSVLVAKNLIDKGAAGNIVATNGQYQVQTFRQNQVETGAISDPGVLRSLVAAHDIYPGQQLTLGDFVAATPNSLQTSLTGDERAISIPIDAAHGLSGQISPGDHVDVYAGLNQAGPGGSHPVIKLMMENALVLRTASTGAPPGSVVLRADGLQTAAMAFASDNGKLWLVLRPATGAAPEHVGLVDTSVLLGMRPVH